jgi:hypothetical protein
MAATYKNRFLRIMRNQEKAMRAVFARAARLSQSAVVRHSVGDEVPRGATKSLQTDIGRIVETVFIGTVPQTGHRAPFYVRNGDVMPLSPYMAVLWESIDAVTELAVREHAAIIERHMPDDIVAMARARASTTVFEFDDGSTIEVAGAAFEHVSEFPDGFKSNPFAQYEPAHTWVDPNGYRLSDRIWNTSDNMRGRMDAFISQSIREGKGALRMSKELEQFMIPGRGLRTRRPYGQNASFEAMRLARTETTRAHASAFETAAMANPFVTTVNIVLSRSHPKRDICDDAAAGSPYLKDAVPDRYKIPLHPHCLCHYTANVDEDIDDVVDRARERIKKAEQPLEDVVGPAMVDAFKQRLLRGAGIQGPAPFGGLRSVPFVTPVGTTAGAVVAPIAPVDVDATRRRIAFLRGRAEATTDTARRARMAAEIERLEQRLRLTPTTPPPTPPTAVTPPPTAPAAPAPVQPAPTAPATVPKANELDDVVYDLSEGTRVRESVTGKLDDIAARRAELIDELETAEQAASDALRAPVYKPGSTPNVAQLNREFRAREAAAEVHNAKARAALAELESMMSANRDVTFDALKLPEAEQSTIKLFEHADWNKINDVTGVRAARQEKSAEFVNAITRDVDLKLEVKLSNRRRASAAPGEINIHASTPDKTIVHELGHNVEYSRGRAGRLKRAKFFNDRTAGDVEQKFVDVFPERGFGKSEKFKSDRWEEKYTGKVSFMDTDDHPSSEVISTGIEWLYVDAAEFIKKDPEFFDFIVSYLRGTL